MESMKESAVIELVENDLDVLSIDDSFVWVDKMLVTKTQDTINWISTNAIANVAQQNIDTEDNNHEKRKDEEKETSDDDREFLVEQQYWEQHEYTSKKLNSSKPKYTIRQRKTQRELDMFAYQKKTIVRSPTYYLFDKSTTLILKKLRDKNIVGDYHNIVGRGKNSVVIHANWPESPQSCYGMGIAVKVYKLTNDSKYNDAILNRVQREHNHLNMLHKPTNRWCVSRMYNPFLVYKCRNVIAMSFYGYGQETAPSIASVPARQSEKMYHILVKILYELYNDLNLIHGRLSTRNILYWCEMPKCIGWAHSVKREHPMALRKLMEDCHFITQFFQKQGVVVVMPKEELFQLVSGHDKIDINVSNTISRRDLWNEHLTNPNKKSDNPNNKPTRNCRFK